MLIRGEVGSIRRAIYSRGGGVFSAWKLHTEYFPPIRMNPCRFMEGGIIQCCSDKKTKLEGSSFTARWAVSTEQEKVLLSLSARPCPERSS